MLRAAYDATGDNKYLRLQRKAFDWFLGANDLHVELYDFRTKGCNDGLMRGGVNRAARRVARYGGIWPRGRSSSWATGSPGAAGQHGDAADDDRHPLQQQGPKDSVWMRSVATPRTSRSSWTPAMKPAGPHR